MMFGLDQLMGLSVTAYSEDPSRVILSSDGVCAASIVARLSRPGGRWYAHLSVIPSSRPLPNGILLYQLRKRGMVEGVASAQRLERTVWERNANTLHDRLVLDLGEAGHLSVESVMRRPNGMNRGAVAVYHSDSPPGGNYTRDYPAEAWEWTQSFATCFPESGKLLERLRLSVAADPFVPFVLRLHSGPRYIVTERSQIVLPTHARSAFLLDLGDDHAVSVRTADVASLEEV